MLGRKWSGSPGTSSLSKQIDKVLPKVAMNHHWMGLLAKIKTCYWFEPIDDQTTRWTSQIGFKPGMLNQPKIKLAPVIRCAEPMESLLLAA